ncbi:hypothetical protein CH063_14488 [Colletotrichum higginsianum]|uniref:Uncharacterized protein n=1 Tax=Colletotrichum higginsianum (strain IMI 349063) TaxID=759273 RepID=H1VYS7_COLHI|nr:hypothetical protein CH63R_08478 [Colletotrichum higginsianum IMI 349063]OBR06957.1 hypothetical protein CH63R_08478 [Colletotrichum higginsianum IMI 349063]CCF45389.1 hypothetical protein CH063_14488 [Colletotrichum higginsianum]
MPRGRRQTELKDSLKFQTGNSVEDPETSGRERETTAATEYQTSDIGHWGPDSGNVGVLLSTGTYYGWSVVCLWKQTLIGLHHITGES